MGLKGFVIGFVGRFSKDKGLETLIRAVSKLDNYTLFMIGMGEDKGYIKKLAKNLGVLDKIIFNDVIPMQDLPRYYNCLDVLVLPSLTRDKWKEQFGHVLIEAMSCEVPVIGSDSGEIPNVIGDAGLVFKEGNVEGLKRKLEVLIKNRRKYKDYAKLGRKRILEHYTHEKIVNKLHDVFQGVLNKGE